MAVLQPYMPAALPVRRRPATLVRRSSLPPPATRAAGSGVAGREAGPNTSIFATAPEGGNVYATMPYLARAMPMRSKSQCSFTSTVGTLGRLPGEEDGDAKRDGGDTGVDGIDSGRVDGPSQRREAKSTNISHAQSTEAIINTSMFDGRLISTGLATNDMPRPKSGGNGGGIDMVGSVAAVVGSAGSVLSGASISDEGSCCKGSLNANLPSRACLIAAAAALDRPNAATVTSLERTKSNATGIDMQTSILPSRSDMKTENPNGTSHSTQLTSNINRDAATPTLPYQADSALTDDDVHREGSESVIDNCGDFYSLPGYEGRGPLIPSDASTTLEFQSQSFPISPAGIQKAVDRANAPNGGIKTSGVHNTVDDETNDMIRREPPAETSKRRSGSVVAFPSPAARSMAVDHARIQRPKSWSYHKTHLMNSSADEAAGTAIDSVVGGGLGSHSSSRPRLSAIDSLLNMDDECASKDDLVAHKGAALSRKSPLQVFGHMKNGIAEEIQERQEMGATQE